MEITIHAVNIFTFILKTCAIMYYMNNVQRTLYVH